MLGAVLENHLPIKLRPNNNSHRQYSLNNSKQEDHPNKRILVVEVEAALWLVSSVTVIVRLEDMKNHGFLGLMEQTEKVVWQDQTEPLKRILSFIVCIQMDRDLIQSLSTCWNEMWLIAIPRSHLMILPS